MLIPTKPPGSSTLLGHPGPPFTGSYLTSSVSLSGLSEPNPIYLDTRCGHFFPEVSTTCLLRVLPGERGTAPLNLRCPKPVSGLCCTHLCQAQLGWRGWNPNIDTFFAFPQLTSLWGHLGCWEKGDYVST